MNEPLAAPNPQGLGTSDDEMGSGLLLGFSILPVGAALVARLLGASWGKAALIGGGVAVAEVAVVASGVYHPGA